MEQEKPLATLNFLEDGIELQILLPGNKQAFTVSQKFAHGGFAESGAGLYLAQNYRDARIVSAEVFSEALSRAENAHAGAIEKAFGLDE